MHTLSRDEILSQLQAYLHAYPHEQPALAALSLQLQEESLSELVARSNMRGHVTTSALVFDPMEGKVLLICHNLYQTWLPPGGHYEDVPPSETVPEGRPLLAHSAFREVTEETGVSRLMLVTPARATPVPLDIDTHAIPANPKKGEGPHFHHDVLYLAMANSLTPLHAQESEVSGARWESLELLRDSEQPRLRRLYQKLVNMRMV